MAGNYTNYPEHRLAYEKDGTVVVIWEGSEGLPFEVDSTGKTTLNSDAPYNSAPDTPYSSIPGSRQPNGTDDGVGFLFPQFMDIDAVWVASGAAGTSNTWRWEYSTDTTNGLDGTWTAFVATMTSTVAPYLPASRQSLTLGTAPGARGIRAIFLSGSVNSPKRFHIFGTPTSATAERLALWHPSLNQRVDAAYFDWGNVPRGSSADLTFRVKNLGSTQTANSIALALSSSYDTTPSVPGQFTLSSDGITFTAGLNIGSLAPSATSTVLTMRRITPSTAALGHWAARVSATAGSWT